MKHIVFVFFLVMMCALLISCSAQQIVLPAGYGDVYQLVSILNWAFYAAIFLAEVTLGWVCLYVAWRKGYSPVGFFFFGFFLFIPAIIVLACLKPKGNAQINSSQQVYAPFQADRAHIPVGQDVPVQIPKPFTPVMKEQAAQAPLVDAPSNESKPGQLPQPANPTEEELVRILKLKERGIITDVEYEAMRKRILGL